MKRWTYLSVACAAFLVACDKGKEPLIGPREEVFEEMISPKAEMKRDVNLPNPVLLKAWPMAGGNSAHQLDPIACDADFKELWRASLSRASGGEARLINGPVSAEGLVFAIDAEGEVSALDLETGELRWQIKTFSEGGVDQAFGGGLAYDQGMIYITTASAEVLALKAQDGEIVWRHPVSAPVRSAPTIADGRLYVTTINNQLDVFECQTGQVLWSHAGIMESAGILGGSSVAVKDGVVIVPYSSGEIFALRRESGATLWSDSLAALKAVDSVSALAHIKARPVIHQGKVLVISHSGRMNLHDLRSGAVLWSKEIGGIRSPAVSDQTIFMVSNEGYLLALDYATGKIIWSKQLPRTRDMKEKGDKLLWAGPIIVGHQLLLSGSHGKAILCSVQDGTIEKVINTGSSLVLSPISAEKTFIWLTDQGELIAYR